MAYNNPQNPRHYPQNPRHYPQNPQNSRYSPQNPRYYPQNQQNQGVSPLMIGSIIGGIILIIILIVAVMYSSKQVLKEPIVLQTERNRLTITPKYDGSYNYLFEVFERGDWLKYMSILYPAIDAPSITGPPTGLVVEMYKQLTGKEPVYTTWTKRSEDIVSLMMQTGNESPSRVAQFNISTNTIVN